MSSTLKEDVIVLKGDVSTLKENIIVLKDDVSILKEDSVNYPQWCQYHFRLGGQREYIQVVPLLAEKQGNLFPPMFLHQGIFFFRFLLLVNLTNQK